LNKFEETIKFIDDFCIKHKFDYAVIGGTALIYHNSFRTTNDIDVTINIDFNNLENLADCILNSFKPILNNPKEFFKKNFVLPVILEKTQVRVDFTPGLSGFDINAIKRSKRVKYGEIDMNVCTAEDLLIYKLVASRPQDLVDIQQLLKNNPKIDKKYLTQKAGEFIEIGRSDILDKLQEFLK